MRRRGGAGDDAERWLRGQAGGQPGPVEETSRATALAAMVVTFLGLLALCAGALACVAVVLTLVGGLLLYTADLLGVVSGWSWTSATVVGLTVFVTGMVIRWVRR